MYYLVSRISKISKPYLLDIVFDKEEALDLAKEFVSNTKAREVVVLEEVKTFRSHHELPD